MNSILNLLLSLQTFPDYMEIVSDSPENLQKKLLELGFPKERIPKRCAHVGITEKNIIAIYPYSEADK